MAYTKRIDIEDYGHGEALELTAALSDDDGAMETGTVVLRIGPRKGAAASVQQAFTHVGGGTWTVTVTANTMAQLPAGETAWYEIWETSASRRCAYGKMPVDLTLGAPD